MRPAGGSDVGTMGKLLRRRTPELTGVKSERGFAKKNRGALPKGELPKGGESGARRGFLQALIVEGHCWRWERAGNRLRQFFRCDEKPVGDAIMPSI
jgi:hypothetical protein